MSASSGIEVTDLAKDAFVDMKKNKTWDFLICRIQNQGTDKKEEELRNAQSCQQQTTGGHLIIRPTQEAAVDTKGPKEIGVHIKGKVDWSRLNQDEDEAYKEFLNKILTPEMQQEPCYMILDVPVETRPGVKSKRLVFVHWCLDDAKIKPKLMSASSMATAKKKFDGVQETVVQISDPEDFTYDELVAKLKSK